MTRVELLSELKKFCADAVKNMELPVAVQKGDTKQITREPNIYLMRLSDSKSYEKLAPYIIVQLVGSKHFRDQSRPPYPFYEADVRFIFCVQCEDEQEGAVMLLNLMDRVQECLLKKVKIGKCFVLDEDNGLETVIYPDDTKPFYAGEMFGTFKLIPIEREVDLFGKKN